MKNVLSSNFILHSPNFLLYNILFSSIVSSFNITLFTTSKIRQLSHYGEVCIIQTLFLYLENFLVNAINHLIVQSFLHSPKELHYKVKIPFLTFIYFYYYTWVFWLKFSRSNNIYKTLNFLQHIFILKR